MGLELSFSEEQAQVLGDGPENPVRTLVKPVCEATQEDGKTLITDFRAGLSDVGDARSRHPRHRGGRQRLPSALKGPEEIVLPAGGAFFALERAS